MNNEAKRLNVRGLLGVSDFCISIDGNKKSVGEFIEFREPSAESSGSCGNVRRLKWFLSFCSSLLVRTQPT